MSFKGALLFLAVTLLAKPTEPVEEEIAATVVRVSGQAQLLTPNGPGEQLVLGQLLSEGDQVRTSENATLQLLLADGSSLTMGPNSELVLSTLSKQRSFFHLLKGVLHAIVEQLSEGSAFEVHTAHAVAAVKGTEFEVAASAEESAVTVQEGEVELADAARRRSERIPALHKASARLDRLQRAFRLPRRELLDFHTRWERARAVHAQRHELRRHFLKERPARLQELRKRRKLREHRLKRLRQHAAEKPRGDKKPGSGLRKRGARPAS